MARVHVYVDGFNLYYGVKGTPYKWLNLLALCRMLLPKHDITAIKYFTARVSARPNDAGMPLRQQVYIRALQTLPGLSVVYGHFLTHSRAMTMTGSNPPTTVRVDRTDEKGSDVNLASHLLMDGFLKRYEMGVLLTNDSDQAEPVRLVTQELKLPVGILCPRPIPSVVLRKHATFVRKIKARHFKACQFPETLTDRHGSIHKPTTW